MKMKINWPLLTQQFIAVLVVTHMCQRLRLSLPIALLLGFCVFILFDLMVGPAITDDEED
jgi:hypothetical protein